MGLIWSLVEAATTCYPEVLFMKEGILCLAGPGPYIISRFGTQGYDIFIVRRRVATPSILCHWACLFARTSLHVAEGFHFSWRLMLSYGPLILGRRCPGGDWSSKVAATHTVRTFRIGRHTSFGSHAGPSVFGEFEAAETCQCEQKGASNNWQSNSQTQLPILQSS